MDDRYRHRHGSPGHGGDHLLPVLVSDPNDDNPARTVRLSFLAG